MYVPPSKHMIYNLSFGWHTLYCTTIVLKFPMDAPFVVKANYYSPLLAPLALLVRSQISDLGGGVPKYVFFKGEHVHMLI